MEKKNLKAYVKPATENVKMIVNGELCMTETEQDIMHSYSTGGSGIADSRKKRSIVWEEDAE